MDLSPIQKEAFKAFRCLKFDIDDDKTTIIIIIMQSLIAILFHASNYFIPNTLKWKFLIRSMAHVLVEERNQVSTLHLW